MATLVVTALSAPGCDRQERSSSVTHQGAATPAEAETGPAPTRVAAPDHGFSLLLPARWAQQARTAAGADVYRSADGSAQITVSTFSASLRLHAATRDELLTALLDDLARRTGPRWGLA
jgi:hypothetical protein